MRLASLRALLGLPLHQTTKQTPRLKRAGFIQPMGKGKAGWFHPAHGERKSGLVSSSPWGKEKRAGFIQPMGKGKAGWFHPAHGEKKSGLVSSSP
jgi:hypothetical protein